MAVRLWCTWKRPRDHARWASIKTEYTRVCIAADRFVCDVREASIEHLIDSQPIITYIIRVAIFIRLVAPRSTTWNRVSSVQRPAPSRPFRSVTYRQCHCYEECITTQHVSPRCHGYCVLWTYPSVMDGQTYIFCKRRRVSRYFLKTATCCEAV